MTDKELLTLAAKAAGYGEVWYVEGSDTAYVGPKYVFGEPIGYKIFNPLNDDGDALRLAVKLNLIVGIYDSYADVCHTFIRGNENDTPDDETVWFSSVNNDPYAATRRAIVRAAAAIGQEMP